ncbi:MAG: peptide deformylase [Saprospiraceae bacterium]|nr:peptide deformylase [Saprospiraceae bacterium]MCB0624234.1 peptide deformylase [Saprospiraceae bacterium]MCB0678668.1 peptide deformylase [Saprospiraceae bacterium]MCB0680936.1 peptide deformylase [Saprospiraceae bacterium]
MILPIYGYGQAVLKKVAEDISPDYPQLDELIANMWDTMYKASGVGLAAPQVGLSIRLFVVDTVQIMEEGKEEEGIKQVFINARKLEEAGDPWAYEEGCLSIPDIRGDVERPPQLRMRYLDEQFVEQEKVFTGVNARVIQHEYDHIEGKLFIEHLKPIKRKMIQRRLENIRKGQVQVDYSMKFLGR